MGIQENRYRTMSQWGNVDPTPKPLRGPWEGENKIIVGIDIGTTQSGVAFAYLQTGGWRLDGSMRGVDKLIPCLY